VLDAVFGAERFVNEVIWKRTFAHGNVTTAYGDVTDTILFYAKSEKRIWNQVFKTLTPERTEEKYPKQDEDGRRWQSVTLRNPGQRPNLHYTYTASNGITYRPHPNGWSCNIERMKRYDAEGKLHFPSTPDGALRLKMFSDESAGERIQNLWEDIPPLGAQAQERLGYPTQKPVALLERILSASSNPGDVVLDPFCGCGTTIHAAQKLGRQWLGIDVTHLAISLIERRLKDAFPDLAYEVVGTPRDLAGARDLAERDKYQFQWWATSLIEAVPAGGKRKGMDRGVDGYLNFRDEAGKPAFGVVSIKGGENVSAPMIRDLKGTVDREKAALGVFVSLVNPTREMIREAVSAGFYETGGRKFPKIQLFTIAQLLDGRKPEVPFGHVEGFRKAAREKPGEQRKLL